MAEGRGGVVKKFLDHTTPSARTNEASRLFLIVQPPLLLLRRGADCCNFQSAPAMLAGWVSLRVRGRFSRAVLLFNTHGAVIVTMRQFLGHVANDIGPLIRTQVTSHAPECNTDNIAMMNLRAEVFAELKPHVMHSSTSSGHKPRRMRPQVHENRTAGPVK